MAARWLVIRVDLLQGRGEDLDPPPGRVMMAAGSMTFGALAHAIDVALGRWDHSHLCKFTLEDGTQVTSEGMIRELVTSPMLPVIPRMVPLTTKLSKFLKRGSRFEYVFDFGDDWTHACQVEAYADPLEELGIVPDVPLPRWGWGNLPDQYGRRWAEDEGDPEATPPAYDVAPIVEPEPEPVDVGAVRRALAAWSTIQFLDAVIGHYIDGSLQHLGAVGLALWARAKPAERARLEPVMWSVMSRLELREVSGDRELADVLLAELRRETPPGRELPVDLDMLAFILRDTEDSDTGGYLNTATGEVAPAYASGPGLVGEDAAIDEDDDAWTFLEPDDSHGWQDMADFANIVSDSQARTRLLDALDGKGAFSRFRRTVDELDLRQAWLAYADDRQLGRARAVLAELGIRPAYA